jgi:hypothetical protein
MIATSSTLDNPFPTNAVTTFGVPTNFAANFEYMRKARAIVIEYLQKYPDSSGGLALSGGHGSGKTFLLNWLNDEARKIKSRESYIVYAKVDTDDILELYRQILKNISRLSLIEVTRKAVLAIGRTMAGEALATHDASREIRSARDLQPAFDQKILDPNEIYLLLRKSIQEIRPNSTTTEQVAYAIGILEHPEFGDAAYTWLAGDVSQLPKDMPLQASLWPRDRVGAADISIAALECIARLYRISEMPFILILDQMENFLPAGDRSLAQASLLKKWVEQLSGQGALVLMAGTPGAWGRLPRDVGPRLLNRGPLAVGGLNADETALLLRSYLRSEPGFSTEMVETIRNLSGGGNAREVLQIAHRVFAKTGGSVSTANERLLVEAADESGSLRDRATLALQMIDAAAERLNLSATPVAMGDRPPSQSTNDTPLINRLIAGTDGPRLTIVLLTSSDARTEASDARKVTELRKHLAALPNQPELLVVTIGYSSGRVVALVGEISRVLAFDESSFQDRIEGELRHSAAPAVGQMGKESQDLTQLLQHLTKLDSRLARIEAQRVEEQQETVERLERGSHELAEPERLEAEAKTRYELRFGLDELHEALADRDEDLERRILRRLLVGNEANVKDKTFDYLGTIYLDSLDGLQLSRRSNPENDSSRSYAVLRSDLIRTMRTELSSWNGISRINSTPIICSIFGLMSGLFVGLALFESFRYEFELSQRLLLSVIGGLLSAAFIGGIFFVLVESFLTPQRRYRPYVNRLDKLRIEDSHDQEVASLSKSDLNRR